MFISCKRIIFAIIYLIVLESQIIKSSPILNDCPKKCLCTDILINSYHLQCKNVQNISEIDAGNLSVISLNLSYNNLIDITNVMKFFPAIIDLNVSYNNISEIGHLPPHIKKLNISHNSLTSEKLNNLPPYLVILDLSYNDITYLPMEMKNLNYLNIIKLDGNQIHCTCETIEVRNMLNVYHSLKLNENVECEYPKKVKGKSWNDVLVTEVCGEILSPLLSNSDVNDDEKFNDVIEKNIDKQREKDGALSIKQQLGLKTFRDFLMSANVSSYVFNSNSSQIPIYNTNNYSDMEVEPNYEDIDEFKEKTRSNVNVTEIPQQNNTNEIFQNISIATTTTLIDISSPGSNNKNITNEQDGKNAFIVLILTLFYFILSILIFVCKFHKFRITETENNNVIHYIP